MNTKNQKIKSILILDNIRSVYNVGSIFRTADAVGIDCIYLIGMTPQPIDQFGKMRKDFTKTSLGAEETVPWIYAKTISPIIKKLQREHFVVLALEQTPESKIYTKIDPFIKNKNIAMIVGNEVDGVSSRAISLADHSIEIPMKGMKESLNVSVATGIALYKIINI